MEAVSQVHAARPAARLQPFAFLRSLYLKRLMRTLRGRAFVLSFMAQAEEADEKGVFDTMLARVPDPELGKMIRIHRDDEIRHASMLRDCLARLPVEPPPVPAELRVVDRIDRHVRVADALLSGRAGIMEGYLLLQVIEERGVRQFPRVAEAMRPFDPATAAVIDRITRDEERHVRYAKAISMRYAPDAETLERTLLRYRAAESRAFAEHASVFLAFATEHRLDGSQGAERLFWRTLAAFNRVGHRARQ